MRVYVCEREVGRVGGGGKKGGRRERELTSVFRCHPNISVSVFRARRQVFEEVTLKLRGFHCGPSAKPMCG